MSHASVTRSLAGMTALVTGANGGVGAAFVAALLAGGASRVYAAMRDPSAVRDLWLANPRIVPLDLDVTDRDQIARSEERRVGTECGSVYISVVAVTLKKKKR